MRRTVSADRRSIPMATVQKPTFSLHATAAFPGDPAGTPAPGRVLSYPLTILPPSLDETINHVTLLSDFRKESGERLTAG